MTRINAGTLFCIRGVSVGAPAYVGKGNDDLCRAEM